MPAAVSNRVSPPEQAGSNRLVMAAGNSEAGDTCRTFIFHQENHTLGNALRHVLLLNPRVAFAGYTIPHPAEDQMHLRIQIEQGGAGPGGEQYSAQEALTQALKDLRVMAASSKEKFMMAVKKYREDNPDNDVEMKEEKK